MKTMLYLGLVVSVVYEQFQVAMMAILHMEIRDDTTNQVSSLYATTAASVS